MTSPRREIRQHNLGCRATSTQNDFVLRECERLNLSVSAYLSQLITEAMQARKKSTKAD